MDRRRSIINYSIKRQFQVRLLITVMVVVFISIGLNGALFYIFSNQEIGSSFKQFHVHAKSFLDLLLPFIAVSLAVGLAAALAITLFLPHRIAGPLFRMERDIKDRVGEGDFTVRFSVRKGDELADLAESLNTMEAKLKSRLERLNASTADLVAHVQPHAGDEQSKKTLELAKKVDKAIKEFKI